MEDEKIVSLFLGRDENAITECKSKYHGFLSSVSFNILNNKEDGEECVNDTYLSAWHRIPPEKPRFLRAFLSKITRNISLNKLRFKSAEKRGGSEALISLDELCDFISAEESVEDKIEAKELSRYIEKFLLKEKKEVRILFVRRYFFFDSVKKLAQDFSLSENAVKMRLSRLRKSLADYLREENLI
ncbi:MAG: sigma-70 family RNA polymerase sigma factor [Ruminococcaceae bacterium]|nr:sigma-70 family RNA polymerase sigma factor [Oscillospiraceae bacterium]